MLQCHIYAYGIAVVTVYALASVDCAYNCSNSLSLCFVFLCPLVLCVVLFYLLCVCSFYTGLVA